MRARFRVRALGSARVRVRARASVRVGGAGVRHLVRSEEYVAVSK